MKPFDIVSAPYTDLNGETKRFATGEVQKGLFLVISNDMQGNVLACKITSQYNKFITKYCYTLTKSTHEFLQADSYVQLNKWHTLDVNKCKYIGSVLNSLRLGLLKQYDIIIRDLDIGLKDNIHMLPTTPSNYVSPNRLQILLAKERLTPQEVLELYELKGGKL